MTHIQYQALMLVLDLAEQNAVSEFDAENNDMQNVYDDQQWALQTVHELIPDRYRKAALTAR